MFLPGPSARPSVHGGSIFFSLKTRLWGFEKVWGVFDVFDFCPCVRALRSMYYVLWIELVLGF